MPCVLIDGRNRWAACQMAGVDPRFDVLNGQDPVAYILSSNVARRHMNAGQRAMVTAKAKISKLDNLTQAEVGAVVGAPQSRMSEATTVLKYRSDLADDVIAGILPLNDAYTKAKARKEGKDSDDARRAELQRERPELWRHVTEEAMTLSMAWAAYQQGLEGIRRERRETTRDFVDAMSKL